MAEIKNPEAYFGAIVRNSYKNEFRANDNFFNHISSVGDESDIQQESKEEKKQEPDTDFIERRICEASIENWLLFMENERLHKALSALSRPDLELLFILKARSYSHREAAKLYNVTHTAIGKKYRRILNFLKNSLNN